MELDYEKLRKSKTIKPTNPRKIFSLLRRQPRFKRPLDEQADVLADWYRCREGRDVTIKMNTGGGKTVVGLLCLQSSLNENVKPAVYITPDKFLVSQVLEEAKALGINATKDEQNSEFLAGRSILVATVHKLFNARSVFGVSEENISIGCIVIDDAHACLGVVNEQFCIKSRVGSSVYNGLFSLFGDELKKQSNAGFLDIQSGDKSIVMQVPYWTWQSHQNEIYKLLYNYKDSNELKWSWPLLRESINQCSCFFGGSGLEITPHFIPIDRIPAFDNASRRIYMTATLADDTILVSHFKADVCHVVKPIRPEGGGDIGDRMILLPQEINPAFTDESIKKFVATFAKRLNVVVIVPSNLRSIFWKDVSDQVLDKDSIKDGIDKLKAGHVGLTVLINKYDGIDLPGKACELLVIDGLPEVYSLKDRSEMQALDGTKRQLVRQVQRIEQGMGRGVRSSDDHCVVLLLGGKLTQRLHLPEAEKIFSPATRTQINLGKSVAEQVERTDLNNFESLLNLCLEQDEKWVETGRAALLDVIIPDSGHIEQNQVSLREAFDAAQNRSYEDACLKVQQAVNQEEDRKIKGFLKQQLAQYTNFTDPAKAQEIQLAALQDNSRLLKPIEGVTYRKLSAPASNQATAACNYMKKFENGNDLVIWVKSLLEDLKWGKDGSKQFEAAMFELGLFLGFGSQRPEDSFGCGPDNLWALGNNSWLVIECKSGSVSSNISKTDTNQLNGSIIWFVNKYSSSCSMTPIMVHPQNTFERDCAPHKDIRVLNNSGLQTLDKKVSEYTVALTSSGRFMDAKEVEKQLDHHQLSNTKIVQLCTVQHRSKPPQ